MNFKIVELVNKTWEKKEFDHYRTRSRLAIVAHANIQNSYRNLMILASRNFT